MKAKSGRMKEKKKVHPPRFHPSAFICFSSAVLCVLCGQHQLFYMKECLMAR